MAKRRGEGRGPKVDAPAEDGLAEYRRRRDLERSPEPPGTEGRRREAGAPIFMVHKHHASTLHYDLRLEIDGRLASWAVPKGPSYDPKVRRLAVRTEDHPLEYADFEGRIPDGGYGAGDSLIWDRGLFETVPPGQGAEQREAGRLHLQLQGSKLRGLWYLIRTGRPKGPNERWLLFKADDAFADPGFDVTAEAPASVVSGRRITRGPETKARLSVERPDAAALIEATSPPMQPTLASALPQDDGWWFELKYDGYRALAAVSNGKAVLRGRSGLEPGDRFVGIRQALERLVVGDAVIDGELCALDPSGTPRFERLQRRRDEEVIYFTFDLLYLDGEDLRERPLEERRDLLTSLLANAPPSLRLAEVVDGSADHAMKIAARRGYEGVVAKRIGSRYVGGRASSWRKRKVYASQELAVVGFTRTSTGTDAIGALLLAVAEGDGFRYAGKVGTGFTADDRAALFAALQADVVATPALLAPTRIRGAVWVRPRLVAQVRFAEWTSEGRLRQPSFQGLREDKKPRDCVRESAAGGSLPEAMKASTSALEASALVTLTHPDRLLYPRDGITKRDVAAYYEALAGPLLKALADRPVALEHWNEGIDQAGWFHQNHGADAEAWMTIAETPSPTGRKRIRRLMIDDRAALRWLAQRSALTIHMWSSRLDRLLEPDWAIFDLDPAELPAAEAMAQAVEAARALHLLLDALSLPSLPKTSGKRGLHVLVPMARGHSHRDAVDFALTVGRAVAQVLPFVTMERTKSRRHGRLYLDCLQNGYGKTIVAPYSLRAVDGATVSAPLRWSEVAEGLDPSRFNLRTMPDRVAAVGDLFGPILEQGVRLPSLEAHEAG